MSTTQATNEQALAAAKLAAAIDNLANAKCSKIKYEIYIAKEHLAACKKAAKAAGVVMPNAEKKGTLRSIAGRVSWRNS